MNDQAEKKEEGTIATAYLRTTEQRIVTELVQEAEYMNKKINANMISEKMKAERAKIIEEGIHEAIKEGLMSMLYLIEERVKNKLGVS